MKRKIFIVGIILTILMLFMCIMPKLVSVAEDISDTIKITKTVTSYEQYQSDEGGEIIFEISNIGLKENAIYKYKLEYDGISTQYYEIPNIEMDKNKISITLKKDKTDILQILKITDKAYLTVEETIGTEKENIIDKYEVDVKLPMSKAFKVGHFTSGYHGIVSYYGVSDIQYKYTKVNDENVIKKYLKYLKEYDSNKDDVYWGYYVDNLIDELDLESNLPNDGWIKLPDNNTTDTQPTEEGLYFIWIKAPKTDTNKEIIGCVFSKRFNDIAVLEKQLEDIQNIKSSENDAISNNVITNESVENKQKDNTVAKDILPKTGKGMILVLLVIILSIVVVTGYIKVKKYSDIK